MTTVVLGWDALDSQLLKEFGLEDAFGEDVSTIDTFDNDVAGEPLTREVWPSIITGEPPESHGIHAATDDEGIEWDNPVIDTASEFAQGLVPHSVRVQIGKALRNRGQEVKQYDADYYSERDIPTIFDSQRSRAISIPNHRVEEDQKVGVGTDRTSIWTGVLESVDTDDGQTAYRPLVPLDEIEEHLLAKAHKRVGLIRAAVLRQYDLVFAWFGYLDTVGHLDVMVESDGWQRRHYEMAANMTRKLRADLEDDDTLVCVSDHGLREGEHTHDATIAGPSGVVDAVDSVFDVRTVLEEVSTVNEGTRLDEWASDGQQDVEQTLESLGYL